MHGTLDVYRNFSERWRTKDLRRRTLADSHKRPGELVDRFLEPAAVSNVFEKDRWYLRP